MFNFAPSDTSKHPMHSAFPSIIDAVERMSPIEQQMAVLNVKQEMVSIDIAVHALFASLPKTLLSAYVRDLCHLLGPQLGDALDSDMLPRFSALLHKHLPVVSTARHTKSTKKDGVS